MVSNARTPALKKLEEFFERAQDVLNESLEQIQAYHEREKDK